MGLFDGLKMMGDIVKGGIAAVKASGKLEELVQRSQSEYKSLIKPEQARLYQEYVSLKDAKEKEPDVEKQNAMSEKVEAAAVKYMSALAADPSFPQDFRDEAAQTVEDVTHGVENLFDDVMEKYAGSKFKTPEEKEAFRLLMAGGKISARLTELTKRSQDEFKALVKPAQAQLYQAYKALSDAREKEKKQDKKNAMTESVDAAERKYLEALAADASFPQDFRNEITSGFAELDKNEAEINALNEKMS